MEIIQNLEEEQVYKIGMLLCLTGIVLMLIGFCAGYLFAVQPTHHSEKPSVRRSVQKVIKQPTKFEPIPTAIAIKALSTPIPTVTPANTGSTSPIKTSLPVTKAIPSDWKSYTATDPDVGVHMTLSLPPGYTFSFTGSEFIIQRNDPIQTWYVFTSVFRGNSGLKNYYDGGSRRVWYQKYIAGDTFGNSAKSDAKIVSVDDTNPSYLTIRVTTPQIPDQINYVAARNGIIAIFQYDNNQSLQQYIPKIVASLSVSR